MNQRIPTCIVRFLAAVLFCFCASIAFADELFSVNGLTLGEPLDSVLNDPRFECGGVSGCFLYTVCTLKEPGTRVVDNDIPLKALALHFTGERLTAVETRFSVQRFDEVAARLTQIHGAGYSGVTAANSVYIWKRGSQVLRLERVLSGGLASSLIVSERSFLSELIDP